MKILGVIYIVILIIVLSMIPLISCAEKEEPSTPPYGKVTQTYSNSEYGFSLEYPEDWDIVEDVAGYVVVFTGPSLQEYIFTVNINLKVEQFLEEVTIKDFLQMVELANESKTKDYTKVSEYDTIISGQSAKVVTLTAIMRFDEEAFKSKAVSAIFIKDNVGYIITYDVPVQMHEEYKDCFELVIDSFEFE